MKLTKTIISLCSIFLFLALSPNLTKAQQTLSDSMLYDGIQRYYTLYVPDIYSPSAPTPLVFNIHGFNLSPSIQMEKADFRPIADTANFIVVHPSGSLNAVGKTHWNYKPTGNLVDDLGFLEALMDTLSNHYNIDQERIYSTGFSQGGYMSLYLACLLNERMAAVAPLASGMLDTNNCFPQHPTPIMQIHGTADSIARYVGGIFAGHPIPEVLEYWRNYNQCDLDPIFNTLPDINTMDSSTVEHYRYTNGQNGVEVEHYKILGGAHTWPGSLPFAAGTNYDFNATLEIWRFFSKYDINGLRMTTSTESISTEENTISIFPNPSHSWITIEQNTTKATAFNLFSLEGKLMQTGTISSPRATINLSDLPPGFYVLKLRHQVFKILKLAH